MDQNFVEVLTKFSADLHPSTLRNVTRSFQSILDDLLLTYRERLGGIVLGYHDERIVSKTAAVNAFYPYFHVDAEATLSVLRLEEDKHLVGRINKLAPDYIGMLVLGAFNAVVYKDQLKGKFRFDKQAGVWVQSSDQTCRLKAGSMVKFAIQRVEASSTRFLIIGSMLPASCSEYEPPGAAAIPPSLGLGLAAGGAGRSGAAPVTDGMKPRRGPPPAAEAAPPATDSDPPPRLDGVREKKKKKKKARLPSVSPEAQEIAELLADEDGADVDGAAAAAEEDEEAAAPAMDADAAASGDEAAAAAVEVEADADPPKPKKKKKKKQKSRAGEGAVAGDEAVESGAGVDDATGAAEDAAAADEDPADEADIITEAEGAAAEADGAPAAPKKRKSKAGAENGEQDPVKKKKKKKKAQKTEGVLEGAVREGEGEEGMEVPGGGGGAAAVAGETGAEGAEHHTAEQPVRAEDLGKKRKKRQSMASDEVAVGEAAAQAAVENGAAPTSAGKKRKKSRNVSAGDR